MTIETYHSIFLAGCILTVLLACVSIVLFVVFDVKKIVGIKLGFRQKKSVNESPQQRQITLPLAPSTEKIQETAQQFVSQNRGNYGKIELQFYKDILVAGTNEIVR